MTRYPIAIPFLMVALCSFLPVRADSAAAKNNEGNRLYEERQYDEALRKYMDAQASRPEAAELHYNIGNALYRKAEHDKAIEEYRRAESTTDPDLAQAATFNRGNALMMQERVEDAINAYIQALRAKPTDQDAKRNLELAMRLLEEKQKQQQSQDGSDEQKQENENQSEQDQPKDQKEDEARKDRPRPKPGAMSEEDARRILEAIKEEERRGIRKHARATAPETPDPEKDW